MKPSSHIRQELTRIGTLPDGEIDTAATALLLASVTSPKVALDPYQRHLDRLVADTAAYTAAATDDDEELPLRAEALRQVIAKRYGYGGDGAGDTDPEDANLIRVIDRRSGVSVALGLIYLHAAGSLGWHAVGLTFPARFLVRLEHDGGRIIIDPMDGGRITTPAGMRAVIKAAAGNQAELKPSQYHALGNREVLRRLQNSAKVRLLHQDRVHEALDVVETMLLFAPDTPGLWREAGLLNVRLDNVKEAVTALEEYLRRSRRDAARYRTSVLLQELRGRLG